MRYELNIYGEHDEIVKTYGTNILPWGVFVKAASMQEALKKQNVVEQMNAINQLLQSVFAGLTDEELAHADSQDIMSLFMQITSNGNGIGSPKNV